MSYTKTDMKKSITNLIAFSTKYGRKPNTVWVGKTNYSIENFLKLSEMKDAKKRIDEWIKNHNSTYPAYVTILDIKMSKEIYKQLWTFTTKTGTKSNDEVFNYFEKVFGKVGSIDEALTKVKDRGYGHYYNNKYTNKTCIDRMKNKQGINCTDACQVFWHIAKALGYSVTCLHVQCSSGEGHVRLQLSHPKHTSGNKILRDPAAVLSANGQPVTYNWCTKNYKLIATNPAWFMQDLNK